MKSYNNSKKNCRLFKYHHRFLTKEIVIPKKRKEKKNCHIIEATKTLVPLHHQSDHQDGGGYVAGSRFLAVCTACC